VYLESIYSGALLFKGEHQRILPFALHDVIVYLRDSEWFLFKLPLVDPSRGEGVVHCNLSLRNPSERHSHSTTVPLHC